MQQRDPTGSSAYLEAIFETIRDPLLVLDSDLRVVAANRAFYRSFQVSPEETTGRRLYDLGNGQWDIEPLRDLLERILPQQTTIEDYEVDHTFERIGRRVMLLNARRLFSSNDHMEHVLLVIEDVTERREVERRARTAEERFRLMVENAREFAIFMMDLDRRIQTWNTGAERVLGWSEDEAVGKEGRMIFTPEDREKGAPEQELATAREQGSASDERWHLKKDGSRFWASGMMFRMDDENGTQLGWLKIIRDLTEKKQAEDALRKANETLEQRVRERTRELKETNKTLQQRNRELQDFAFVASHDLQEPLRKVTTFASMLRHDYADRLDERGHAYIERMENAAERMSRLVQEILSFSRVMTRGQPFQELDLNVLLRRVLSDLEEAVNETGAQIDAGPLPTIEADPLQMHQLLYNLLQNSLTFQPKGNVPRVRMWSEIVDHDGEAFCRLGIEDNGIGFEEKYLDRIFAPFQRLHGRGAFPGTGMGLAVAQRIVERHGGRITAKSRPGAGSTFCVELPLHHAALE